MAVNGSQLRFVACVLGLYASFIYWGYLQEKITSTKYPVLVPRPGQPEYLEWSFAFGLNFFMALGAFLVAWTVETLSSKKKRLPVHLFWRAAVTCSLASPIGYYALNFIPFPLMVLAKSSKPVPVMLMGIFVFGRKYPWYKYASVLLVCGGIGLFTLGKETDHHPSDSSTPASAHSDLWRLLFGMVLVLLNLILDGYTNNAQDEIFTQHSATSLEMMKNINFWQVIYLLGILVVAWYFEGDRSELVAVINILTQCPAIRIDIILFCMCAAMGQILIFVVMQEFGSLVWITVSITRKLFTILLSIFMFNHSVQAIQWLGIASVFAGLVLETAMSKSGKQSSNEQPLKKGISTSTSTSFSSVVPQNESSVVNSSEKVQPVDRNSIDLSPVITAGGTAGVKKRNKGTKTSK